MKASSCVHIRQYNAIHAAHRIAYNRLLLFVASADGIGVSCWHSRIRGNPRTDFHSPIVLVFISLLQSSGVFTMITVTYALFRGHTDTPLTHSLHALYKLSPL